MVLIELIILIVSFILICEYRRLYSEAGKLINKLPGPPIVPIFGNIFTMFYTKVENFSRMNKKNVELYYPTYRFWTFYSATINICNPEDAEIILSSTKHIKKGKVYNFIKPWLKTGLLLSTDSKWQVRRKMLTSAFHFHVLNQYLQILNDHGAKIVESLKHAKETTIELIPFWTNHTLNAICEAAMGVSLDSLDPEEINQYREAILFFGRITVYRFLRPWFANDFIFSNFTAMGREMKRHLKVLHGLTKKIIQERTEFHRKTGYKYLSNFSSSDNNIDEINIKKRMAMLDLLIAAQQEGLIDEEGIREEVDTFVFEGHDTSAMGLCYIIQLLAEHNHVQEKARAEVNRIWQSNDETINMNMLNKLTYLEQCIKESLRLFPSVPVINRDIEEDLKLKNYLIPAGTPISILIFAIHRDANYWTEPDKFDPDRFIPERIVNRHPFCYIPFSGGLRNCIGKKFAMMELKVFCANILKHFHVKTTIKHTELDRMLDLVYRPVQKMEVQFIPINNE